MLRLIVLAALPLFLHGQSFTAGEIVEKVVCQSDQSQSYALYLPSNYSPSRQWSVVFAFDPRARGRMPLERYSEAAEEYGYILAGSNNSRNSDPQATTAALAAVSEDVSARFAVDPKRVYTAGMSGGARVALGVALASRKVAGVIASAAGYPDSQPRRSVPFVLFATAGTEDFNLTELRRLDQALTTPHRLRVFEGGHGWPPTDVAREAIEWLELQAIRSGLRPPEAALVAKLFARRAQHIEMIHESAELCLALEQIAADFDGIRDVTSFRARAASLRSQKQVRSELKKERQETEREERLILDLTALEQGLGDPSTRASSMQQLRRRITEISQQANAPEDTPYRRLARRVLSGLRVGAAEGRKDPQYRHLLEETRPRL